MSRTPFLARCGAAVLLLSACSASRDTTTSSAVGNADTTRASQVVALWRAQLDSLGHRVDALDSAVSALRTADDVVRARTAFVAARTQYKHVEAGVEYYAPSTSRAMNGPALPEVEEEEGPEAVFDPTGFQVIEEALYGEDPVGARDDLVQEVRTLRSIVRRASTMMQAQAATDAHVFDAVKLELARIVVLGLAGFDSPVAGLSLLEADAALDGVRGVLAAYRSADVSWQRFDQLLTEGRATLQAGSSREDFDHFGFVVEKVNPLARALQGVRMALAIGVPQERRAFRMDAATVFDTNAFDPWAFAPNEPPGTRAQQVALGERLFHDPRLSVDGTRACSSCHIPERAFTDGLPVNRARSGAPLARNTPTVINSGVQVGQFADLRTTYLEDQVTDVIENVDEMHGSLDAVVRTLASDEGLVTAVRAAFAVPASDTMRVSAWHIRSALAAYQRSLTRLDSPVDRALRGDSSAITPDVRRGFNVFVGKGKCATCHFLPLTNGTVPPMYQKTELEVIGVATRDVARGATIDADPGRYRLSRAEPHKHAFRTPSIRNVALTAPYMHNGAYPTLESVVTFYNRGGGAGIGAVLPNQTLPADSLGLTAEEQRALVAFMRALTDTTGTTGTRR